MIVPLIQKESTILIACHAASQTRPHIINMFVQTVAQTAWSHMGRFFKDNHNLWKAFIHALERRYHFDGKVTVSRPCRFHMTPTEQGIETPPKNY